MDERRNRRKEKRNRRYRKINEINSNGNGNDVWTKRRI
jgi:hypothetical protein